MWFLCDMWPVILQTVWFFTCWGRVMHICVSKLTIIGSDNGLSPARRQAIIWTNAGILLIGPLGTNLSEILIEILTFSFKKMLMKVLSAKRRPFCLGLNVLTTLINTSSASCIYIWDTKIVISVSADVLAPNGLRPLAGPVKSDVVIANFPGNERTFSYHHLSKRCHNSNWLT